VAGSQVTQAHDAKSVRALLDLPEIMQFISDLDELHWTGRTGFGSAVMVGAALVKAVYALPTWSRTARLTEEHDALRAAIGGAPSQWACYRFAEKLRKHGDALATCIDSVLAKLRDARPEMGQTVAIDGSDLPAYANGQRYLRRGGPERKVFSDPDASWGHRSSISTRSGGGYYGYKVHCAVDTATGLPVAWQVRTAKDPEQAEVPGLLDEIGRRGFKVDIAVLDKGYDAEVVYSEIENRHIRPIIPLIKTKSVKDGKHKPPSCDHGEWAFAGSDFKRGASKWRCPAGECAPKSVWIKASRLHLLVPRSTDRFREHYSQRGAVEREFGVLKHQWGLLPLRLRRIERVRLHVDLTILATLADAAMRADAGRLAS
jgi:Transposase DDE domain